MKLTKITLACALMLATAQAQAKYKCNSPNSDGQLEVFKQTTHLGDTIVSVKNENGKSYHFGNMKEEGSLFVQKTVDFHDVEGKIVITHFPNHNQCGRGSCLPGGGTHISAQLTIEEEQSNFYCYESIN